MAGRFVLLEFKTEEQYEGWAKNHGLLPENIRGLYYKPTFFCKCPDRTKQTAGNWVRAKRFGIFICRTCRRPSIFHAKGVNSRLEWALGKNLMED